MYTKAQELLTYGYEGMSVRNLDLNEVIPLAHSFNHFKESVCSYKHYQPNSENSKVEYDNYMDE